MTEAGLRSGDTDWHLDTLYGWARALGASVLGALFALRGPEPSVRRRQPVSRPDQDRPVPDAHIPGRTDIPGRRRARRGRARAQAGRVLAAYHDKLRLEIERIRAEHGAVLLWEAHSIASVLPRLFEGKLPDLNIGTADGASCAPDVLDAIRQRLEARRRTPGPSTAASRRPHHAPLWQARDEVHAVQLEMCQSTYMDETYPYAYRPELAARVTPVVEGIVGAALERISARGR